MNREVKAFGPEALRQAQRCLGWQIDIKHSRANVAIKMAVFLHIRAEMGRSPIQRDLPHQAAFDQGIQAVIHSGHRDFRHVAFSPDKYLLGGRMVAFAQQDRVHVLALRGETKTARRQSLVQRIIEQFLRGHSHEHLQIRPCRPACQYLE